MAGKNCCLQRNYVDILLLRLQRHMGQLSQLRRDVLIFMAIIIWRVELERKAKVKEIRNAKYKIRNTKYEVRNTKYEIWNTKL